MSCPSIRLRGHLRVLRRASALCLALLMASGCYTHPSARTRVSPRSAATELEAPRDDGTTPGIVAVVLADGSRIVFSTPTVVGSDGVLRGTQLVESGDGRSVTRPVEVPWDRVEGVVLETQERRLDWGKTLGLVLGIPAGVFIAGIIMWAQGDGFNGLGEALSPLSSR